MLWGGIGGNSTGALRLRRRLLFGHWRNLWSQKHKLIRLSSLLPLSPPSFPTFGFPSSGLSQSPGLWARPLPLPRSTSPALPCLFPTTTPRPSLLPRQYQTGSAVCPWPVSPSLPTTCRPPPRKLSPVTSPSLPGQWVGGSSPPSPVPICHQNTPLPRQIV